MNEPRDDLGGLTTEEYNRYARAGDDERKARLEGRLPTKAEQEEENQRREKT
jgi:hypothetical protein